MNVAELVTLTADKVIDARGTACPGPLLEAKKGIGAVKVGQVIEVKSNDKGSRKDLSTWATKVGHEFLGLIEADGHDRLFVLRKK
ncbi:MAG: sulfurtransferase TusA family protein [Terriglobia bacterium]|jgi:TusA-related sulfurtransferase|nr:sulfurtransferase TusA family protein [Terriglobia bacterium]